MRGREVAGVLLVLLLAAGSAAAGDDPGRSAFLIMPFENIGEDPALAWLSTGLALHTGEHLRGRGGDVVDDEERAVFLEGQGIPAGASLTLASALEIGRAVRARATGVRPDWLVLGRFAVQDGAIALSARVIDLVSESARPWITSEGRLKDLLEVHASLSDALAREAALPGRGRGAISEPPLIAFETYCRALAESDGRKRLDLLQRALQEFPGYPLAAFQAASLFVRADQWKEASDALASVTTDAHPYEAEFHLLRATVALELKDTAGAVEAARRSLEFADSSRAHVLLGRALAARQEFDAAAEELERAEALDPSEPEIEDLRKALAAGAGTPGRTQ